MTYSKYTSKRTRTIYRNGYVAGKQKGYELGKREGKKMGFLSGRKSVYAEIEKRLDAMPKVFFEQAAEIEERWIGKKKNPYIEESKQIEKEVFRVTK